MQFHVCLWMYIGRYYLVFLDFKLCLDWRSSFRQAHCYIYTVQLEMDIADITNDHIKQEVNWTRRTDPTNQRAQAQYSPIHNVYFASHPIQTTIWAGFCWLVWLLGC